MLDRIHMFIPFRHDAVINGMTGQGDSQIYEVDLKALRVPLQGQIHHNDDGTFEAENLHHCWESLTTGFTPMAFKVFHQTIGFRLMPGIELKASPAKLLQGHNVFGPTSIRSGAEVMLKWVAGTYPDLFSMLDVPAAEVYSLDCTFSSRLPDERTALQVIQALSGVTNGQTKGRGDNYETTTYWGAKKTRLKRLKAYLKQNEYMKQLDDLKRVSRRDLSAARSYRVMSDPRLVDWVKHLLRLEATVMSRWMERRNIPTRLVDLIKHQEQLATDGRCFIQECWQDVTRDLFKAFEGQTMKIVDDEKVLQSLISAHTRYGKNGKPNESYARNLFRTYRSIRDYGWDETFNSMSSSSFYRHIEDITSAGLSRAALQKLQDHDRSNNIVPLLRFVQVDFAAQRPDWYVEPSVEAA